MPSAANPKLEKQASTEAVDNTPIRQAIVVIEHKIRNLEKRKGKLEGYRDLQRSGKELNADQKVAVAKYDEVINTIEFARELIKSFGVISTASEKEAKKLARKEALQRVQQNVQNIREVLLMQDILSELGSEEVRNFFLAGENGAILLTEDDFTLLDKLYEEITPKREEAEEPFNTVIQKSAEHIISIIEAKPKEVLGTTYTALRDLLKKIEQCEYFNQNKAEIANDAAVPEETENETDNIDTDTADSPQPAAEITTIVSQQQSVELEPVCDEVVPQVMPQQQMAPPQLPAVRNSLNTEAPAPNAVPAPAFPPPQHQPQLAQNMQPMPAQVLPQVPPGIVPVVAALPNAALPHLTTVQSVEHAYFAQQQFLQQQQQQQRPITEMISSNAGFYFLQESELDSPEVTAAPPPQQNLPVVPVSAQQMVTGAPRNTPPPPGHTVPPVQPGPIPSQTYTNQTFAGAVPTPMFPGHPVVAQPVPEQMTQHIPGFTNPNAPMPIPMPSQQQPPVTVQQQQIVQQQNPQQQIVTQQPQQSFSPANQPQQQPGTYNTQQTAPPIQQQQQSQMMMQQQPLPQRGPAGAGPMQNNQQKIQQQPIVAEQQTQAKAEEVKETTHGDQPTDWCDAEQDTPDQSAQVTASSATTTTTNAWHNRQQQNSRQSSNVRETTTPEKIVTDWASDSSPGQPQQQEPWSSSGQGDGQGYRGGYRGRGRGGNRGGGYRGRGGYQQNGGNSGPRPTSGGTYYRNSNDQQNTGTGGSGQGYYQNQNGGSTGGGYNRDYHQGGGFKSRGAGRGAPRGGGPGLGGPGGTTRGGPRPPQNSVRGGVSGRGNGAQYVPRRDTTMTGGNNTQQERK